MSHLSNELAVILKNNGLKQYDVTKMTGLGVAMVSRIFSGGQKFVSDDNLDKIITVLAKTDQDRARIVRARLTDAYNGRFADHVRITLKGGAPEPDRPKWPTALAPEIKAAFEFLYRLVPKKPAVGQAILQLARMMGMTG